MPHSGRQEDEQKPALGAPEALSRSSHESVDNDGAQNAWNDGRKHLSDSWWFWEILAVAISVAAWTVLVVLLAISNGERQDERFRVISINTVVSILVTIAKTMMMVGIGSSIEQSRWIWFKNTPRPLYDMELFDSASRGVYGSVRFLFTIRWHIATLGAILTIVSLGVDAFAQQVVHIESRLVGEYGNTATFAFAHSYSANAQVDGVGAIALKTTDLGMQGAIMKALFNLEISEPYSCPGSCSWNDTYISFGFSSSCQNVTQATIATQKCITPPSTSNHDCNMTTPSGFNLSTHIVPTVLSTTIIITAAGAVGQPAGKLSRVLNPGEDETFSPNNSISVAIFRAPESFNTANGSIIGQEVLECGISLTAYKYSNVRVNGTSITQERTEIPLTKNGTVIYDAKNKTVGPYVFFNEPGLPEFNITRFDWGAIRDFFASNQFSGSFAEGYGPVSLIGAPTVATGPLYRANVTKTFEDIALSMTNQIRSTKSGTELVNGLTNIPVGFIVVEWAWLSLPLATAACSVLLLVVMIVQCRRSQRVPLWKSSALALLDYRINREDGTMVGNHSSAKALQEAAKGIKVKII